MDVFNACEFIPVILFFLAELLSSGVDYPAISRARSLVLFCYLWEIIEQLVSHLCRRDFKMNIIPKDIS
jgi:hypothetical protein